VRDLWREAGLLAQLQKAGDRGPGVGGRLVLLEALTGLGAQTETDRHPSHPGALEVGALQEQTGRALLDLGLETAHHAGDGHRPGLVPDHQVVCLHAPGLTVQGGELTVSAHGGDPYRLDLAAVECVGGLADLEHDVVGEVDEEVVGALTQGMQTPLDAQRRGHRTQIVQLDAGVARAALEVVDLDRVRGQVIVL